MEAIEGRVLDPEEFDEEVFDLDVLVNEAADEEKPFRFKLGGALFTTAAPEDFDWQEYGRLTASDNQSDGRPMMQLILGDEQYEEFCGHKLKIRHINALVERWQAHHGISVPESRASRRSSASAGSARPSKRTSRRRTK
jgi:hypothetical protein